ncbi:collagen alpha-1(VI) chain [Arapaima gigas]
MRQIPTLQDWECKTLSLSFSKNVRSEKLDRSTRPIRFHRIRVSSLSFFQLCEDSELVAAMLSDSLAFIIVLQLIISCSLWGESRAQVTRPKFQECPVDLFFVLDTSESVALRARPPEFYIDQIKAFTKRFIDELKDIRQPCDRYVTWNSGALHYSDDIVLVRELSELSTQRNALKRDIDTISYIGKGTYTDCAIKRGVAELLGGGSHYNENKYIVVVTDGHPVTGYKEPCGGLQEAANEARQHGIKVFAVAISPDQEDTRLSIIATDSHYRQNFTAADKERSVQLKTIHNIIEIIVSGCRHLALSSSLLNISKYIKSHVLFVMITADRASLKHGEPGYPGLPGCKGTPGSDGLQGQPGPKGDPGPYGSKGSKGDPGHPGEPGRQGNYGASGNKGGRGLRGANGDKGEHGDEGPSGPDGTRGDRGTPGEKGEQGSRGNRGPRGETGEPGPRGDTGREGSMGPNGDPGPKGPRGIKGSPGDRGLMGERVSLIEGEPGLRGTEEGQIRGLTVSLLCFGRAMAISLVGSSILTSGICIPQNNLSGSPGSKGAKGHRGSEGRPVSTGGRRGESKYTPRDKNLHTADNPICKCGPLDLAFVVDSSESIGANNFEIAKDFIITVVDRLMKDQQFEGNDSRIGVVQYSGENAQEVVRLDDTNIKTITELKQAVKDLRWLAEATYTGEALQFSLNNMISQLKQRNRVVLVLTDGRSDISRDKVPLNVLCDKGIRVGGLGVKDYSGRAPNQEQLEDVACLNSPENGFTFTLENFSQLLDDSFLQNLTTQICQESPSLLCAAVSFDADTDITIMMDSSASVGSKNFEASRTFVKRLAERFLSAKRTGNAAVRVAVAQYSGDVSMEADFSSNFTQMSRKINDITFRNGATDITAALRFAIERFKRSGNRVKKLLLFSDGRSQGITESDIEKRVREVEAAGIELYVLTVGTMVNESMLRYLVSRGRPYDVAYANRHLLRAADYPSLLRGVFHQTVSRKVSLP